MCQYTVISADSHINEPPDLFERLPRHLREAGPKLVRTEKGDTWFMYPGAPPRPVSTSAFAGFQAEAFMKVPVTYDNMRPGSFDPQARLADMDLDGVEADVLFPGIMRYVGAVPDPETRAACCRAYNDWMAEFSSYDPKRLIGQAVIEIEDASEATAELRRARRIGLTAAVPIQTGGGRPLHHPDLEPFWAAAEELNMPISVHTGASVMGGRAPVAAEVNELPGSPEANLATNRLMIGPDIAALIFSGVFDRHPTLKVVASEAGVGWLPFLLNRMENVDRRHRFHMNSVYKRPPVEYFHENLYATFEEENPEYTLRAGFKNIMWAADYPHTATTWPNSHAVIEETFATLTPEERHLVLAENAARLYKL
jgi:predicted TIM-barrel fold metal-dependent hydrolase